MGDVICKLDCNIQNVGVMVILSLVNSPQIVVFVLVIVLLGQNNSKRQFAHQPLSLGIDFFVRF